mgnify:CR=1 FL=1
MKRLPLAALLAAFFIFLALSVSIRQAVLMLVGVGMGAALAAARFGFTTGWRQLIEQRNPQGVTGQVLLLALASLAALPLLGQFSELHAALGPPSVSLLVGAFVFGLTMQIADGCGSGSLYKAGLGVPLNMGILPLFALGSFLGSVHLDSWLSLGQMAPVSLSAEYGTGGSLALTLALLAAVLVAAAGGGAWWWKQRQDAAKEATAGAGAAGPAGRKPAGGPGRFGGGNVQPVSVGTVQRGDVRVVVSAIGTMSARATAVVRAKVSGELVAVRFKEGDEVRAGQVLAEIDPRSYQAALSQAQGTLQRDQALLKNAQLDLKRYQGKTCKNCGVAFEPKPYQELAHSYHVSYIDNKRCNHQ